MKSVFKTLACLNLLFFVTIMLITPLGRTAPTNFLTLSIQAQKVLQEFGCNRLEEMIWDTLKFYLIQEQRIPSAEEYHSQLRTQLLPFLRSQNHFSIQEELQIDDAFRELYQLLLDEPVKQKVVSDSFELLELLSGIDVGDQTSEFKIKMGPVIKAKIKEVVELIREMNFICKNEDSPATIQSQVEFDSNLSKPAGGARLTMAAAYQNCDSLQLPALNALSPNLEGIKTSCCHQDQKGKKRVIVDLPLVLQTHYYIKSVPTYGPGCFNLKNSPLIYDYGGRPYVGNSGGAPFDLFTNAGSGTKVLGIDCSAFVFTALATAGLKLFKDRPLKAIDVYSYPSKSYLNPKGNGMTCMENLTIYPDHSLDAGDIIAINGHVLMVDSVGKDPFGINRARSFQDCTRLTSQGFDFIVIQSSNSKNGLGINRFVAKDYIPSSATFKKGLESYAASACQAKFTGKQISPNVKDLTISRHKGTSECLANRIPIKFESCLNQCFDFK